VEKVVPWVERIPGGKLTAGVVTAAVVAGLGWAALHKQKQSKAKDGGVLTVNDH
jgi:hypothetical protein